MGIYYFANNFLSNVQKVFDFTHNDLHTNNIVYNKTEKKLFIL